MSKPIARAVLVRDMKSCKYEGLCPAKGRHNLWLDIRAQMGFDAQPQDSETVATLSLGAVTKP